MSFVKGVSNSEAVCEDNSLCASVVKAGLCLSDEQHNCHPIG